MSLATDPRRVGPHGRAALCAAALAAIVLTLLGPLPTPASAVRPQRRIVAGIETKIEQAPFQVALYLREAQPPATFNGQFCGGVILDATHVLTAAHCVTVGGFEAAAPEEVAVLAGSNDLETPGAGAVEDPAVATSFDPEWRELTGEHDLGVLTLEKPLWSGPQPPIDGTSKIAPIELGVAGEISVGDQATVSGWGFDKPLEVEQVPSEREFEEGFPAVLRSAQVSIRSRAACETDYEGEPIGEDLICAIGTGSPAPDACFGDSGGPLFSGEPGHEGDRLLAIVDLGAACGFEEAPGIYQSLITPANAQFARSDPPQAPIARGRPRIAGMAQPGQTLTCEPGVWLGSAEFFVRFFRDESSITHPFASTALTASYSSNRTYPVQGSDAGTRIFCAVFARNAGGYGEALSEDAAIAAVTAVPAPAPAPAPSSTPPPMPPSLDVLSKRCRRATCTVNVLASRGAGAAAVTKVQATLSYRQRFSCHRHGRRATCTRTVTRTLTAKAIPAGHFLITASGLKPGRFTMSLRAIDRAGVRQIQPTKVTLLLRAQRRTVKH